VSERKSEVVTTVLSERVREGLRQVVGHTVMTSSLPTTGQCHIYPLPPKQVMELRNDDEQGW
jgi:hypothetical protein